jgi:GT2 family glycosyltransferase
MITVIYSTHKDFNYNDSFKKHLKNTIGVDDYEILEYYNYNEYSLSEIYNKGIKKAKYDIIVCCHNDIKLENNWGKKLLLDFKNNPDYGIIGKAGSCYLPESGIYWEKMQQTMVGQVYHQPENQKKWLSKFSAKSLDIIPVITIDGLFISFDKTKIKHQFDESIGKFHFYDHGFCVPNYLDNIKIGVTSSFEIIHQSIGQPDQEFWVSKEKFIEKWGNKLPLDLKPNNIYVPKIKEKPIKNIGKVAVIIPTKGKLDLLFDCLDSFIQHCDKKQYEIFIADTGSNNEELIDIKKYITNNIDNININLIQYDYYNFAKINNDVVKNHINNNFEFLLFCNNDIKLLSNVVYNMQLIFKENKNIGTVGGRLYFGDNTIQHNGVVVYIDKDGNPLITHSEIGGYYSKNINDRLVIGNTAALMMIKKNVFENIGYFNENYIGCFEDVELNLKCLISGMKNMLSANSIAYHYESQSRKDDELSTKEAYSKDFSIVIPFIKEHSVKINNYITLNKLK